MSGKGAAAVAVGNAGAHLAIRLPDVTVFLPPALKAYRWFVRDAHGCKSAAHSFCSPHHRPILLSCRCFFARSCFRCVVSVPAACVDPADPADSLASSTSATWPSFRRSQNGHRAESPAAPIFTACDGIATPPTLYTRARLPTLFFCRSSRAPRRCASTPEGSISYPPPCLSPTDVVTLGELLAVLQHAPASFTIQAATPFVHAAASLYLARGR